MTVQAISRPVWCVVFDGTGFFDARKRYMIHSSSSITKMVMTVMIGISTMLWKKWLSTAIEVAAVCMPSCLGCEAPITTSWASAVPAPPSTVALSRAVAMAARVTPAFMRLRNISVPSVLARVLGLQSLNKDRDPTALA